MILEMLPCQVRVPETDVLKGEDEYLTSRNGNDTAGSRGDREANPVI